MQQISAKLVASNPCRFSLLVSMGVFLVKDNPVFNRLLSWSLCSFASSAHSAHLLRFTLFASLAHSIHRRARSLCSVPHGTVDIYGYMFTLKMREEAHFSFSLMLMPVPICRLYGVLFSGLLLSWIPSHTFDISLSSTILEKIKVQAGWRNEFLSNLIKLWLFL